VVVMVVNIVLEITRSLFFIGHKMTGFMDDYGQIAEGLGELLVPHEITDRPDARPLVLQEGAIDFRNVCFSYGKNEVFRGLMLAIPGGQKVGLVGLSGAGKTTLVNLLLRQYEIADGSVAIDGQDIRSVTRESLRKGIATVPQDVSLFHRTIRENIRYGRLDASDAEVEHAAELAQAHAFIRSLPKGYGTYVGERGVKLSGGQRQRVAVARAMLKQARILVLDEATSSLDSESEAAIQAALIELMKGKTVLAIAHRLSTLQAMDRIVVLADGEIVEDGTHRELLERDGLYARLWKSQVRGFIQE
ncbi:MAG: ATP-binding cassette domain-containing protein, partial [Candidatus Peribacteraceae bacterium]|nr:ATP-binding cassette domain-containing protein [Candidatus Peribacteraceae bacterium]